MVCGETALAFLNRNRLLYLDMLEPIRRGTAELLYTESDGVLLYDRLAEAHMLGADTPQALERMLPLMEGCTILTGHQLWYKDRLAAQFGLTCEQICHQAAWLEETPPAPLPFGGELRLLDRSWAPWVYAHYSHAFGGVAYMEGAMDRGMLGAFVDGTPPALPGSTLRGPSACWRCCPPTAAVGSGRPCSVGWCLWPCPGGSTPTARYSPTTLPPWPSSARRAWRFLRKSCSGCSKGEPLTFPHCPV